MAATTMRELSVTSPPPALTMPAGPVIDENQNNSHDCVKPKFYTKKGIYNENHVDSTVRDTYERGNSPHSTSDYTLSCNKCHLTFAAREHLYMHNERVHNKSQLNCSTNSEDCTTSNNLDSNSSQSGDSKTESSPQSDDSVLKSLRSARRSSRREDGKRKSDSDSESWYSSRRKQRSVNNNESPEEDLQCFVCSRNFSSWSVLQHHMESVHPERHSDIRTGDPRKRLQFSPSKVRLDRKNCKTVPKIGFKDIDFVEFSSEKFALVAKDVCEKSLHLSKDDFSFECRICRHAFPCARARDIHAETCELNQKNLQKTAVKKNKRKSTPKFRPQAVTSGSDDSDDNIEVDLGDKQRIDFFNSLDLRNNGISSKCSSVKSSEDEGERKIEKRRGDLKPDLADIQSMISVTNIPALTVKNLTPPQRVIEEKPQSLNIQVGGSQSSPGGCSTVSLSSPNFSVLSLISPSYSSGDQAEEEAQDCFAAECRRMKLRGEFPCKLCTQVFPNLRALKGHNRVHVSVASGTANSPYRCNICSYTSLDKATLIRHMRSHNGDRPYECAMCNYAFTTKANCERHLRNRHSKMTRDDVKSSIIYHPSEDPINDSEYQRTTEMNRKNIERTKDAKHEFSLPINLKINLSALKEKTKSEDLFQAEHQQLIKNMSNGSHEDHSRSEAGTMTEDVSCRQEDESDDHWDGEEALDLRVNKSQENLIPTQPLDEPEDLTKKVMPKEYNNNEEEKYTSHESRDSSNIFDHKEADLSNLTKLYATMHPSLNLNQIQQIILSQINPSLFQRLQYPFLMPQALFHNSNYAKNFLPKDALGLQMSGGSIMGDFKRSGLRPELLAKIMNKREEDFIAKPTESFDKLRLNSNAYFTESDKKAFQKILVNRELEVKEPSSYPIPKPIIETPDSRNTSVKMVIKNGVLMPKQKQRRYRTERPFSCEHCSARFTLRSNMERHIKQQHPQHWTQKSRYNVGTGRKSDPSRLHTIGGDYFKHYEPSTTPTSLHSRGDTSSNAGDHWEGGRSPEKSNGNNMSDDSDVEEPKDFTDEEESKDDLIIDEGTGEDRMRYFAASEYLNKVRQAEQKKSEENHVENKDPQPQDLASVSKMLDNAVTQTQAFQKYFQDGARKDEDEYLRDEGDRSEEEEGLIAGSTSSDENRSESDASTKTKKKSAYSLAPNRVSCPYCFRKFPWTSSLRRHVLTHTGQKPFKCTHCPLLFTTKSNCDRHLLRKHGREALIASSGHTENHEGNNNITSSATNSQSPNYTMRNVPERPYKCTHCPSSTFSSLSNLNKHMSSKHPNGEPGLQEPCPSPEHPKIKNINPQAPPNVTISPNFPLNIPKALSIIPHLPPKDAVKPKRFQLNVPLIRVQEWANACNGEREKEEQQAIRKRSSSDEAEASDKKRSSPDILKITSVDSHSDAEPCRMELPPIPASELPFKCHLCEGSFGERSEALDHIRSTHPTEFQLLISKGALDNNSEEDRTIHDDHDDTDMTRGRFPDYANRKVMCAFCMRRFWSAEDLRRHMRTHTGERPFSCDVCQRKFTLKHSMLRHRKKHSSHDELLVGSDEEHHNNNLPLTIANLRKSEERDESPRATILHQTLTRREDCRERLT